MAQKKRWQSDILGNVWWLPLPKWQDLLFFFLVYVRSHNCDMHFFTIFDMKPRGKISSRLMDTVIIISSSPRSYTLQNKHLSWSLQKVVTCFRLWGTLLSWWETLMFIKDVEKRLKWQYYSRQKALNTNAHTLVHSAYMLTQRKQRHVHRQAQRDTNGYKNGK